MSGRWTCVTVAILVASGCSGTESGAPTDSVDGATTPPAATSVPTTATRTTTTISTTTTSTTTTVPVAGGSAGGYLVIDPDGVRLVDRAGSSVGHVVDGPVESAVDDGSGGVLHRSTGDDETWFWRPSGWEVPIDTRITRGLPGTSQGRPVIVTTETATGDGPCGTVDADGGEVHAISVVALDPTVGVGPSEFLFCQTEGADDWFELHSYRDGLLLEVHAGAAGWIWNDGRLLVVDRSGAEVDLPDTAFTRATGFDRPRELTALLSWDATLLAIRHRPDNCCTNGPDPDTGELDIDQWREMTASIPAIVRVVQRADGAVRYETEVPFGTELADFDGRYVVLFDGRASTVVDTAGVTPPATIDGRVVLVRSENGAVDATWPPSDPPVVELGDTGPWVSHLQLLLDRPDAPLAIDGVFGSATRAAAVAFQRTAGLAPDGIVGPATWATLLEGDAADGVRAIVRVDGIGPIDRGTPAAIASAALTDLLGSPDRDEPVDLTGECVEGSDWVDCAMVDVVHEGRILSWDTLGLDVILTDQDPNVRSRAVPLHLGGWRLRPGDGDVVLATTDGLAAGSTLGEVRRLHPDLQLLFNEGLIDSFLVAGTRGDLLGRFADVTEETQTRAIQRALNAHGASLVVDGSPGPATFAAWDAFVAAAGLDCPGCPVWFAAPEVAAVLGVPDDATVVDEIVTI